MTMILEAMEKNDLKLETPKSKDEKVIEGRWEKVVVLKPSLFHVESKAEL
jgi:hypothetical protein